MCLGQRISIGHRPELTLLFALVQFLLEQNFAMLLGHDIEIIVVLCSRLMEPAMSC